MRCLLVSVAASILVPACGGSDASTPTADADPTAPDAGRTDDSGGPVDAPGPTLDGSPTCEGQVAAIGTEMYQSIGSCTVVVRLDYQSLAMLGWQLVCAPYGAVDEATARATAFADTGYGATGARLNDVGALEEWVFFQAPGDFGGAAAVSARTGRSVFGGSIVWDGAGDLTWPTAWRPPVELGCADLGQIRAVGYDLENGTAGLAAADLDAALAVIRSSPFPAALWTGGYVFDAVVLRYPRTVGAFNPGNAEWIVLLNGGWLE
jgi:hypothetical protein